MGVNVTTGKRGDSGRGADHIARPGVNAKGELRAWCGSPIGGDIRENVTELPDGVHDKCVAKMNATISEGDAAIMAGKPTSPDYSLTAAKAHVSAVHARWERARLARVRAERSEAAKDVPDTRATTPEPATAPKCSKKSAKSTKTVKRLTSPVWEAFASALVAYRLDPETDVVATEKAGVVYVVPKSEKALKRIRDRARKINNRMASAGVEHVVEIDWDARVVKLVNNSKESK